MKNLVKESGGWKSMQGRKVSERYIEYVRIENCVLNISISKMVYYNCYLFKNGISCDFMYIYIYSIVKKYAIYKIRHR